jgi:hypothetical protein
LCTRKPPPRAQSLEQHRREHRVAILAPFALLYAQGHALAIDIGDLQADDLSGTKTRAVGHCQRRLVLELARRNEQPRNLLAAQDHRQRTRLLHRLHLRH